MSARKMSEISLFVALNIFAIALAVPINYFMGPKKLSDDEIVVVGPLSFHKLLYQVQEFDFDKDKFFAVNDNQSVDLAKKPVMKWLELFSDMIGTIGNMNNASIYVDKMDLSDVFYLPYIDAIVYRGKVKHFDEGEEIQSKMLSLIKSVVEDVWQLVQKNKADEATLKELTEFFKKFNEIVKELEADSKKINFTELLNVFNGSGKVDISSDDSNVSLSNNENLKLVEGSEYEKTLANITKFDVSKAEEKKMSTGESNEDEIDEDGFVIVKSPNDVKLVGEEKKSFVGTKVHIESIKDDEVIDLTHDGHEENNLVVKPAIIQGDKPIEDQKEDKSRSAKLINYFLDPKKLSDNEIVVVGSLSNRKVIHKAQEFDFDQGNQAVIEFAGATADKWIELFCDLIDIIEIMSKTCIYVDKMDLSDVFYVPRMFGIVYRGKVKHFNESEETQPKMLNLIKSAVEDVWKLVEQNKVDEATLKELTKLVIKFKEIVKELEADSKKINFTELWEYFNGCTDDNDKSSDDLNELGSKPSPFSNDDSLSLPETSECVKSLANTTKMDVQKAEEKKTSISESDVNETHEDELAKETSPKTNDRDEEHDSVIKPTIIQGDKLIKDQQEEVSQSAEPINYFLDPKNLSDNEVVVVGSLSNRKVIHKAQEFDFGQAKSIAPKDNQTVIDLAGITNEKWAEILGDLIGLIEIMNKADIYVDKVDLSDVFYVPHMIGVVYRGKVKQFDEGAEIQLKILQLIKSAVEDVWQLVQQNEVDEAISKELTEFFNKFREIVKELESNSKKIDFAEVYNVFNDSNGFGSMIFVNFSDKDNLTLVEASEDENRLKNSTEVDVSKAEDKKRFTDESNADEMDEDGFVLVKSPKSNDVKLVAEEKKSRSAATSFFQMGGGDSFIPKIPRRNRTTADEQRYSRSFDSVYYEE